MKHFQLGLRWVTLLISLTLGACATPPQTDALIRQPLDLAPRVELSAVPFYAQRDYQCGPAALATVLNFPTITTSVEALIEQVYVPELKGSLRPEMIAAAASHGRLAIQLDGTLASLLRALDAGLPVLVFQNLGLESLPFWHYAVAIGYDLNTQQITLRSGERERLQRPFSNFERTWQRGGWWAVVVTAPDTIPSMVSEQALINALLSLEQTEQLSALLTAYQNAVNRWPDSFILHMGLGNAAYRNQQFALAEQGFRSATSVNPKYAEAWNNLAFSLAAQQRGEEALDAVQRAIGLAPQNAEFQDSLHQIQSMLAAHKHHPSIVH